ncbi:MAG: M48 family metallopeptidase [Candidatus Zixiibacteriota bacterium]|nr:MAG: M48 family metallopeptidase [candidate division Zixibacteria bacterium]
MKTFRKIREISLPIVLLLILSCAAAPVTGRKQLLLIPNSELNTMSFQQYSEFISSNKLSADKQQTAMVKNAGLKIQRAVEQYFAGQGNSSHLRGYEWEFNLVEDEAVNAWCMPGGKVVVYTGILPVTKDETGLAVVMGHEIAHAVANHGNERMSQGLVTQLGGMALAKALETKKEETQNLFLAAYGVGATVGVLLPYSRTHESEADHLGLIFMAMAGYNPNEAVAFWERMAAGKSGAPPEFLSTHPSDETRIRKIKEALPEAMQYYKP